MYLCLEMYKQMTDVKLWLLLDIGISVRQGPGFNPRSCYTKGSKMVLDTTLLNTRHYEVRIKANVEQSRERNSAIPYTLV